MATPSPAADVGIDPNATWLGFMNVSEIPSNGGGYVFGSGWGTPDLTAIFTNSNTVLTLGPNSVNDVSPFWYTPAGGPGSTGNKICDANFYQESTGVYTGQTLNFSGTVLTNTMIAPYTQVAFIKDFASDYSSNVTTTVPLTPGPFTVSSRRSTIRPGTSNLGLRLVDPTCGSPIETRLAPSPCQPHRLPSESTATTTATARSMRPTTLSGEIISVRTMLWPIAIRPTAARSMSRTTPTGRAVSVRRLAAPAPSVPEQSPSRRHWSSASRHFAV